MTRTYRTNLFVLCMMLNQLLLSFLWPYIVYAFSLDFVGQMIFTQLLTFILPIIIFFTITKEPIKQTLNIHPLQLKNVFLIILLSFFIQPFMSFLSSITAVFFPNEVGQLFLEVGKNTNTFLLIIAMAVSPAICEELFFRGVTLDGYKNIGIIKACIFTGLMFGLMHLDGQQFLYAFIMGILFCYLVYKTKSIFASMLAHFTINASQTLLAIHSLSQFSQADMNAMQSELTFANSLMQVFFTYIYFIVTLPPLIITAWIFMKVNKNTETKVESFTEKNFYFAGKEKILNIPFFMILLLYTIIVFIFPFFLY